MVMVDRNAPDQLETRRPEAEPLIPASTARTVGFAWLLLFPLAVVLEPRQVQSAGEPWWAVLMGLALFGALGATAVGLAGRRRFGLLAASGAGALLVTGSLLCPSTGHHAMGLWWFGQLACVSALAAISVRAYRSS
jgi:hypothetical protein